jgi:AraC-like DNA-binding protein/tetratricopeptide (TPR) repeat protein
MVPGRFPRNLKKAIDVLRADPGRGWTIGALAASCDIPRRTLEKHFRRHLQQTPVEFLRAVRLDCARHELLRAAPRATVTEIALQCGFNHFGRFAAWYREQYGESPLATLKRSQSAAQSSTSRALLHSSMFERPTISLLPFALLDPESRRAAGVSEQIAAALARLRWITVTSSPNARYHLGGRMRADGRGQLRVTLTLRDASSGKHLWADCWNGGLDDTFEFEDRVSTQVAGALQSILREAETHRANRKDPALSTAWELTMRALPSILTIEPAAAGTALELLERAMELAPGDALPVSMAAWCRGLRAAHHFTAQSASELQTARMLAARASGLTSCDPLAETMLAAAHTLAHDLDTAAVHVGRALTLDGGSAWAWGRSGWIHAYRGNSGEAIERFQIARNLAPSDPLNFLAAVGIAAAHFEVRRYEEAIRWYRRALVEQPKAIWINRFLTAGFALAGRKDEAKSSLRALISAFPSLTIAQIRSGLPHTASLLDSVSNGLESVGMRIS